MFAFFIPMLWGALGAALASLIGRALIALFIGFVTYTGLSATTDWLFSAMQSNLQGLPVDIANFLGFLWVDKAVTTLASAFNAAMLIRMAGGTSITKTYIKK